VFTVGAAVTWLEQLGVIGGPAELDALAGLVPGPGGVTFVPALQGLGAPFWRAGARGAFTGLSLGTSRAHLVQAVLEGVAAQVAWLVRAVEADLGRPLQRLRVDGGLTRSRVLMQLQADLLQLAIEVYPTPDATALGVAALARLGSGAASDPGDAVAAWAPSAVYEPAISRDEAEARLARWRRTTEATMEL
jgi:glycerol kinase